jgi:hypothetical protein
MTVEWSPKVASIQSELPADAISHFILPDMPRIQKAKDRQRFLASVPKKQRIQTIATCRHTPTSLAQWRLPADKILLVGGNDKGSTIPDTTTLSVVEAAQILQNETDTPLWGVANPNDPNSLDRVEEKIQAGITGFVTQPLLSSDSLDILESYPTNDDITLIVGMALPKTAKNLQFWMTLLEQEPELLQNDPLFQSHLAYFSQPYYTSLAWVGRELQNLSSRANNVDGIHCMPFSNTEDLIAMFRSLKQQQ